MQRTMKGMLVYLGLVLLLTRSAAAYRPSDWVYINWPWAYDAVTGDWSWFNTPDTQWVYGFPPADGWRKIPGSGLAAGWSYFRWPYAYGATTGAWYYINEVDTQWVVNMRTGAWSRFGVITIPDGMVLVPGGTNAGTDPDAGAYSLAVDSFLMDKDEVSKALWDAVTNWNGGNGYSYVNAASAKAANHPVHSVNWYDAVKWCNARSQSEGRTAVYYTDVAMTQVYKLGQVDEPYVKSTANGYRLPTGAQWEYAARGGVSGRRFPWGDTITHAQANYNSSSSYSYDTSPTRGYHPTYDTGARPFTSPAGSFPPNGYGLRDMSGNVWEWSHDWESVDVETNRVVRGGAWGHFSYYSRVAFRHGFTPDVISYFVGFRTVLPTDPPAVP